MDNIVSSPEIIGAIIGGIFLLLTTLIGGWFNVRAAQIRAETELAARLARPYPRKTGQPASRPEKTKQREQKRPLPIWLLVTGAVLGATLLIGGLALSGAFSIFQPPSTPAPSETPLYIAMPGDTPMPTTGTPAPLGFPGNPVKTNSEWTKVIVQTFDGIDMVLVPAGHFTMGSEDGDDDELPTHQQTFERPFWIGLTEVTNAQYGSPGKFTGDDFPRESVFWRQAVDFCDRKGGRLPTEAEWEYAARGPDNRLYPWGDVPSDARAVFSTKEDTKEGPSPVKSKPRGASWVGALDMGGNVWEWVSSLYKGYPFDPYDGRESFVSTASEKRVVRGGSFEGYDVRASKRSSRAEAMYISVGFRCARDWLPSDPLQ